MIRCSDAEVSGSLKEIEGYGWVDVEGGELVQIFFEVEVAVVQVLDDGFYNFGGVGEGIGKALGDDLAFEDELAAVVGGDTRIITGTSQNTHN